MSGPLGFLYEGAVLFFMVISVSQCKVHEIFLAALF